MGVGHCRLLVERCHDGVDNDGDDRIDCADPDCPPCPAREYCLDGVDNDGDGLVDCEDDDCAGAASCDEDCRNGRDDDLDGLVDCEDDDCAGADSCPGELACDDELDNDDVTDCADSDCVDAPPCSSREAVGYWQRFIGAFGSPDIEEHVLRFSRDESSETGFDLSVVAGVSDLPEPPGSGDVFSELELQDDDTVEYRFEIFAGFELGGVGYGSMFVSTNGFLTFGEGQSSSSTFLSDLFSLPGVAGFRTDLTTGDGGRIFVDESVDRVTVTYFGMTHGGEPGAATFQIVLDDGGGVSIYLPLLGPFTSIVGLVVEPGGTFPPVTEFVP